MPPPRLPLAAVPAGLVPMRLATTVLCDEPASTMPGPSLPEITLPTTCARRPGFSPIRLPVEVAVANTPAP